MKMDRPCNARRFFLRALIFFLSLCAHQALSSKRGQALNNMVSAIFVFGDSTVDPRNNNYGLREEGARRIAVVGLPPMGCLPIMITLNSNNTVLQRGCMAQYSSVANDYNALLQKELSSMQSSLATQGSMIYYADTYEPLSDMIQRFLSYGFDQALSGCCGTGLLEAAVMCNPKSYVCPDESSYVFRDSIHPTDKTYHLLFQSLRPAVDAIIQD